MPLQFVYQTAGLKVILIAVVSAAAMGQSQEKEPDGLADLSSNQVLMREKLHQVNRVLEGITLDKFKQVEESAAKLKMISQATSWHVVDPSPRYERLSKNFQELTADLERHAREKNSEAAILDLVRMNITCAQCHQYMRDDMERSK